MGFWNTFFTWRGAHHGKRAAKVGRATAQNTAYTNQLLQQQTAALSQQAALAAQAKSDEIRFRYDTDPVFREWWDKDQAAKHAHAQAWALEQARLVDQERERAQQRRRSLAWLLAPWFMIFKDPGGAPLSSWTSWEAVPRRRATIAYTVVVAFLEFSFLVSGCHSAAAPSQSAAATPANSVTPSGHTIQFEVTTSDGSIDTLNWSTLEDASVESNVASPYVKIVRLNTQTGMVGINASDTSRVQCRLLVDGAVVDEGDSEYAVNCSYTVR